MCLSVNLPRTYTKMKDVRWVFYHRIARLYPQKQPCITILPYLISSYQLVVGWLVGSHLIGDSYFFKSTLWASLGVEVLPPPVKAPKKKAGADGLVVSSCPRIPGSLFSRRFFFSFFTVPDCHILSGKSQRRFIAIASQVYTCMNLSLWVNKTHLITPCTCVFVNFGRSSSLQRNIPKFISSKTGKSPAFSWVLPFSRPRRAKLPEVVTLPSCFRRPSRNGELYSYLVR